MPQTSPHATCLRSKKGGDTRVSAVITGRPQYCCRRVRRTPCCRSIKQIAVFRRSFLHASERERTPSLTHRATSPSRSASPITPKPTFSQVGWVEERGCQVCCQESCPNQRDGDCAAGAPGVAVSSLTRRATASQHTPLGPVSAPSGCPSTSQPPVLLCGRKVPPCWCHTTGFPAARTIGSDYTSVGTI